MSLPQKAVPKSAAPAAGPGPGPANSSQLRTPLATVPLPGPPLAQQPPPVPPTQYPSLKTYRWYSEVNKLVCCGFVGLVVCVVPGV